ncbi:DUF551 domain-containing protein [Cronobacter sakazakii]|uniref:DUF551 domain-containing protein n=1 Tax=Cronobacter sakazakii TaxID=28141 RepID=UPI0009BAC6B6|nr:DUF551 domain-containing protein [Cronobacter sakazakii]PUX30251.1 DUF551 domain-containing protein [Cronobacter sakazakii]PUX59151.1 DUF551 domain-containing protein [Cronobacter sakazakii]PUX59834.1 DUF551 domain-containing protein [Cronobacter sakazakii]
MSEINGYVSDETIELILAGVIEGVQPTTQEVAMARELRALRKILDGVTQEAIDGGWTARGLSDYAKQLETELAALRERAEPVAWRHDDGPFASGALTRSKSVAETWMAKGWKVTPLYTAPPAQPVAVTDDYFAALVAAARSRADKAMRKFPQPNYVLNKVAEENGEVIKAVIHYTEGREEWANVEGEIIDNLAMLIRLVVEGDQVIGFTPPDACRTAMLAEPGKPVAETDTTAQQFESLAGKAVGGWIPCSERMPKIGDEIFYYCEDDGIRDCGTVGSSNFTGRGDSELFVHSEGFDLHLGAGITHWMPLPAAPGKEG